QYEHAYVPQYQYPPPPHAAPPYKEEEVVAGEYGIPGIINNYDQRSATSVHIVSPFHQPASQGSLPTPPLNTMRPTTRSPPTAAETAAAVAAARSSVNVELSLADLDEDDVDDERMTTAKIRTIHKLAERRRRKEMKNLFDALRKTLPVDRSVRLSKWEVLKKAIEVIGAQDQEIRVLRAHVHAHQRAVLDR
ncbi:hypothetical protein EC988_008170, partial [Linderina pennispora]